MTELTARAKSVIKLSDGKCLLDISMPKGYDIVKGINDALPFIGIADTLCWASQLKGLELDLGLAHLATEAKKGLLESCEIALSERDECLAALRKENADLVKAAVENLEDIIKLRGALMVSNRSVQKLMPLAEGGAIDCAEFLQSQLDASCALAATAKEPTK